MSKINVHKLAIYSGHQQAIYALAVDNQTRKAYTAGSDRVVIAWDLDSDSPGEGILKLTSSSYGLHLDQGHLFVLENGVGLRAFDLKNRELTRSVKLPGDNFFEVLTVGNLVITGNNHGQLFVMDIWSSDNLEGYKISEGSIRHLSWYPENGWIFCSTSTGKIEIFDLEQRKVVKSLDAHTKSVFSSVPLQQDPWLITSGKDAMIRTWAIDQNFENAGEIPAHIYGINFLDLSPDEKHFLTCSMDKTIKIWSTKEGKLLKVIDFERHQGHWSSINKAKWLSDDEFISAGDDRQVIRWKVEWP